MAARGWNGTPSVRLVLIAGAAVLALAVMLVESALTASAQGARITTTLQPGINRVGWAEAEADVATLFEAIPRLDRAYAWDVAMRRVRWVARDGSGDLTTLTPGMGLWLALGGTEPFAWARFLLPPAGIGLIPLREGWNFIAWAGRDSTTPGDAFRGLDDVLLEAWDWNATAQRRETYTPNARANTLRTLDKGGAYWVRVSGAKRWWQFPPRVEFPDTFTPARRTELRALVDEVVDFFARHIGIRVPGLTFQFGTATPDGHCGGYGNKVIYLQQSCFSARAHEYSHAIQEYYATIEKDGRWSSVWVRYEDSQISPRWMTEGVANYWSHRYHDETSEQTYDDRIMADIVAVRRIATRLRDLERDLSIGGDVHANYSLGTLAIDWLVNRAGEAAITDFYRQRPSHPDWQSTFLAVFGMTADDFYRMFEERRARDFPPYARVTGSVRGPYARVAGSVRGPGGEPLEGVRVRGDRVGADGENWQAVTDPDGAFGRPVRPGSYRVSFTNAPDDDCHFGWYDGDADLVSRGGEATPVVVGDVDVTGIDIRLPAAPDELTATLCARVEGVVQGPDGEPLRGIHTQLYRQDRLNEGNATDAGGAFSIMVPDGAYRFSLSAGSCRLGIYGADGRRWTGEGQQPVVTVTDVVDVTGIIIRLSRPLAELCEP